MTSTKYPNPCILCAPYYDAEECPPPAAAMHSPGIGHICRPCARHVATAHNILTAQRNIAGYMIPDGERNNRPSRAK